MRGGLQVTVLDGDSSAAGAGAAAYCSGADALNEAVVELFGELVHRHNTAKEIREAGGEAPVYPSRRCV